MVAADAVASNLTRYTVHIRKDEGRSMLELVFEGTANWKSGTECDLTVKGKHIVKASRPPEFGGKSE